MSSLPWAGSLFWKGMLAFLAVVLVAVGTVALLSGWFTEVELRRYALRQSGRWALQVAELAAYYAEHGSWEGVQEAMLASRNQAAGQQGRGRGGAGGAQGPPQLDFWIVDPQGAVVAATVGDPGDSTPQAGLDVGNGLPVEVGGHVVGYVIPSQAVGVATSVALDVDQEEFLSRVRAALWIAGLAATVVSLIVGGMLFRSIVGPLRGLTRATQEIAAGNLTAQASIRGRDEVAQLAGAFNQMAATLARAEEARKNQVADVAHELRTPLTVLQGALEAMLDGVYAVDRENLGAALAQVRTLGRLVEDLRVLALSDAGQLRLHREPIDLGAFLGEVADAYRAKTREQGASLELDLPVFVEPVAADRDRLAQVVGNLLTNALKVVPPGGHITLRAKCAPREVQVSVADDGPGVRPEDLPHLFERFYRGDRAGKRATAGSGLGLTIARAIVEAHGGRIWAESVEGEGSTFTFSLPAAAPALPTDRNTGPS